MRSWSPSCTKIGERAEDGARLVDKDAHDLYRLLAAIRTSNVAETLERLLDDPFSSATTERALPYLQGLFASGPEARGSQMAGRTEAGVGSPEVVAASVAALAGDLLDALGRAQSGTAS